MRKFTLLLVSLLLAGAQMLQAQRTITGTVIDATDKMGIPGASVLAKGTTVGTTTDADGRYTLQVPNNVNILVFQYTGMTTQEIEINGRTSIDVVMAMGDQALEAVEIKSYGSARKIGAITGSVQQVTAKKLEGRPSANVMDALQGQVAGLQVFTSSGEPSATQSIRLHGVGSLGASSTPLYILDGQPVPSSLIVSLNPNDLESITMLKDAAATSIYGSRAANGVIIMTSKRGVKGQDARVVLKTQYGISQQANRKFYEDLMGGPEYINFAEEVGLFSEAQAAALRIKYPYDTQWLDIFQRNNVPTFQTDLSVQGGNERTTYFISGSQFKQSGTAIGSEYERYTLRTNVESQLKKWLTLGTNISLTRDKRSSASGYGDNYVNGGLFFSNHPYYPAHDADGNLLEMLETDNGVFPSPSYQIAKNPDFYTGNFVSASFSVEIEPIKNLKIRSQAGINFNNYIEDYKSLPSFSPNNGDGVMIRGNEIGLYSNITNTIEYSFNLDSEKNHELTLLAGQEGVAFDHSHFRVRVTGLTDDRKMELGLGKPNSQASSETHNRYLSFFGRASYGFQDRIYADFTIRNDASSRFGKENRNATFWAIGGRWNLNKEAFMRNARKITNLNFKVSYGTQGNSGIGDYDALALIGSTSRYGNLPGIAITNPGNAALTWENQKKFTTGIEIELDSRWRMSVEYYLRNTSSMLLNVPNASTSGFEEILGNVGSLQNSGVDVTLGLDILRGKDYFLAFNLNFNFNQEKITELYGDTKRKDFTGAKFAWVVGERINYYLPLYAGVNPENGRQQWYLPGENIDVTTKNELTEDGSKIADLAQNSGRPMNTPINGGFSLIAGWKGLTLQADFAYMLGKYLLSNDLFFIFNPHVNGNQNKAVWDYWKDDNRGAEYPDWTQGQKMQFDTHLLENASFLRLKNLSLSYNFPQALMKKTKVFENIRIFVVGRNLFTATKFRGIDPETPSNLTRGGYVNSRQFAAGIELTF